MHPLFYAITRVFVDGPNEFVNFGTPSALVLGGSSIILANIPGLDLLGDSPRRFLTMFGVGYVGLAVAYEFVTADSHSSKLQTIKGGGGIYPEVIDGWAHTKLDH